MLDIEFDGIADRAGESEEDEQRSLDAVRTAVEGFVEDVCQRCRAEGLDVRSDAPLGGSITDPGLGPRR